MFLTMDENTAFRENLLREMREAGMTAAELSRKAGLNARAVKDIEEGRVRSPKLSTVFALSRALNRDPGEMMGLGPRSQVQADLAAFLSRYDEGEQERFLVALRLFPAPPAEGQ